MSAHSNEPVNEPRDPAELVEKWYRWACLKAREFWRRNKWLDLDDLISAAGLGLWRAAIGYRREMGVPFCGYAKHKLRSEFTECVRTSRPFGFRVIRRNGKRVRDGEQPQIGRLRERRERHRHVEAEELIRMPLNLWELARAELSEKEYDWLTARYRDGMGYPDIAARFGVSKQRVCEVVQRGVAKLRACPELSEIGS